MENYEYCNALSCDILRILIYFMAADFNDEDFVREDENDYNVIIIGAGLAGLSCAYNILKRNVGLDVLIIEKNYEAGGRILSDGFSDSYCANFLQEHVTGLLRLLQINVDQGLYQNENPEVTLHAKRKSSRFLPNFYAADVHHFLQTVNDSSLDQRFSSYLEHEDAKYLAEMSVEQLLRKIVHVPYAQTLCRAYIYCTCGMRNLKNVSSLWFMVMLNGSLGFLNRWRAMVGDRNRYFVQGGMIKIVQKLLKIILQNHGTIRYVESVNEIACNDDRVHVFTDKSHFRCEYIVLAVPPLIQNSITIHSPQYKMNTNSLYTPAENVFFNIVYKEPLWNNNTMKSILVMGRSRNNLNIVYDVTKSNAKEYVLAGFISEPNVISQHENGLFDALNYNCGTRALAYHEYKEYDESLINNEAKAGCPLSAMKPCSIYKHINYSGAPHGRILFTSSDYAVNWPGTVDGAIESGERAAYAILLNIRPQALTFEEISGIGPHLKRKIAKIDQMTLISMAGVQYLGIFLNVAVFLSFLKIAYS